MISTISSFWYGMVIDETNQYINFDEGGGELTATLTAKDYSHTGLATEIARAMTESGGQTYTCTLTRATRKFIISATSNFDLLASTGSQVGSSPWTLIGYTATDKTGTNTYTTENAGGSEYLPQFWLQNYVSTDDFQEYASSSINESGSGLVEVISYGINQFMECDIKYITDIDQTGGVITTNATGLIDARAFMQAITKKSKIEFMEDKDTPSTYETFLLESTSQNRTGVGYRLREEYGRGLSGYYSTGILKFRKVT